MTARVAPVPPPARPGDTVMIDGHPMVVLRLLPHLRGRPPAARLTPDLPCGTCEAALRYDALRRRWCCTECQSGYEGEALADLAREHVRDGVRAGRARRNRVGTRLAATYRVAGRNTIAPSGRRSSYPARSEAERLTRAGDRGALPDAIPHPATSG